MKGINPYRIASVLLVFFAVSHTMGGLYGKHDYGPAAEAVWRGMNEVQFTALGSRSTWYGFWIGFGLYVTVFLIFSSVTAWCLGGLPSETRRKLGPICWALFGSQVLNAYLSWTYFFVLPGVMATVISALIGFECARDTMRRTG